MDKDKIAKKTLYEFKRFARSKGFWEEYKQLSNPLKYPHAKFIDVINRYEPVELIQSSSAFCHWPTNWEKWHNRSIEWAKICIEKKLYFNLNKSSEYIKYNIF